MQSSLAGQPSSRWYVRHTPRRRNTARGARHRARLSPRSRHSLPERMERASGDSIRLLPAKDLIARVDDPRLALVVHRDGGPTAGDEKNVGRDDVKRLTAEREKTRAELDHLPRKSNASPEPLRIGRSAEAGRRSSRQPADVLETPVVCRSAHLTKTDSTRRFALT